MPKRSLPKPRIFISHSAKGAAGAILDKLTKSLASKFEVFVDKKRLIAGQEWRDELFTWMQRAHGAVILFSSEALTSDWVRTEASVLASRQALDHAGFTLIPVLLDPVSRADLERKEFSPMRLSSLQVVRSNNPTEISKRVRAGLQRLIKSPLAEPPMEKLARNVADVLRPMDERDLLNAALAMDLDVSGWSDSSEYPLLLANEMLEQGLASASKAVRQLDDFLGPDKTARLIEMVAPMWVNRHTASVIPQIATRERVRKFWVNGGEYPEFTAHHFVRRACCRTPNSAWPVLIVPPTSGEDEVAHYKRVISESLKVSVLRKEDMSDKEMKGVLINRDKAREPVFVAFFPPGPTPEVIAALGDEFETVTFFILTGATAESETFPVGVELLEPKLQPGEENAAYYDYLTARSYINQGADAWRSFDAVLRKNL